MATSVVATPASRTDVPRTIWKRAERWRGSGRAEVVASRETRRRTGRSR
jgi:hypothetical protein